MGEKQSGRYRLGWKLGDLSQAPRGCIINIAVCVPKSKIVPNETKILKICRNFSQNRSLRPKIGVDIFHLQCIFHANAMHILIPADERDPVPPPLKRYLAKLRLPCSMVSPATQLPAIWLEEKEIVMVVPETLLDEPVWTGLRVRLARSGRFFLIAGGNLSSERVVRALRDGAHDVLDWDRDDESRWRRSMDKLIESQDLWIRVYGSAPAAAGGTAGLLGDAESTRTLRQTIERLGPTDVSVMVLGESGTGKERVAQALHDTRGQGPFVPLNCAAIPRDLIESELFGSEKGAFTGAWRDRPGMVEQAAGGTLFLDEIGELDIALQPKLLRFLETRTARRVGGAKDYRVQLRVVAATNRNLEVEMAEGRFRPDLYYRLAEVMIQIAPLRARLDDLPALVAAFIAASNERFGKTFLGVEPDLMDRFRRYEWPGNVRELKSAIDRLAVLYDGPVVRSAWWEAPETGASIAKPPSELMPKNPTPNSTVSAAAPAEQLFAPGGYMLPRSERKDLARRMMEEGKLSQTEIAARLGVHPVTLYRWRTNP